MKETKITKRIFAVFVAFIVILLISCCDFPVFADSFSGTFNITTPSISYVKTGSINYYKVGATSTTSSSIAFTSSTTASVVVSDLDISRNLYFRGSYSGRDTFGNSFTMYFTFSIDGITLSTNGNSSVPSFSIVSNPFTINVSCGYSPNFNYYYFHLFDDTATPTPEPTPTPVPTPTPEPTFNPDQPTYTTFFNHLLNDGNNALNALYLSWTSANNKFYTGIFFIGLPIMIGIFGIVASIFFGGDD